MTKQFNFQPMCILCEQIEIGYGACRRSLAPDRPFFLPGKPEDTRPMKLVTNRA